MGLQYHTFQHLSECKELVHGVFLRHGGVSPPPFDTLNVGLSQGDAAAHVEENLSRIKSQLEIETLIGSRQIHGSAVVEAKEGLYCDGLMTDQKGVGLLMKHADCQTAIFYDPIHQALAVIHCGWRGNVANIYQNTVLHMQSRYDSHPEDLLVGISPSLGPEASQFINYKTELPPSFWPFQINPLYFDLWEISRWQLEEAKVLPHHIEMAGICTYSHPEDYFSYRNNSPGRHGTVAALKSH